MLFTTKLCFVGKNISTMGKKPHSLIKIIRLKGASGFESYYFPC